MSSIDNLKLHIKIKYPNISPIIIDRDIKVVNNYEYIGTRLLIQIAKQHKEFGRINDIGYNENYDSWECEVLDTQDRRIGYSNYSITRKELTDFQRDYRMTAMQYSSIRIAITNAFPSIAGLLTMAEVAFLSASPLYIEYPEVVEHDYYDCEYRFNAVDHKYYIHDKEVDSVTSILSKVYDIKYGSYTNQFANYGKFMHKIVECKLNKEKVNYKGFDHCISLADKVVKTIKRPVATEKKVFNTKYGYAGTVDCITKTTVIDFKFTNNHDDLKYYVDQLIFYAYTLKLRKTKLILVNDQGNITTIENKYTLKEMKERIEYILRLYRDKNVFLAEKSKQAKELNKKKKELELEIKKIKESLIEYNALELKQHGISKSDKGILRIG